MGPSLTCDAASLISWSVKGMRPQQFFVDRLGLPQKDPEGRPKFEGVAAQSCTALYKKTCLKVTELVRKFNTKDQLRDMEVQDHLSLAVEVTEALLSAHGPTIWGTSEPFGTRINKYEYPQHLRHNNTEDRERIMLYLYCWIIDRAIRRLPQGEPSLTSSVRPRRARASQNVEIEIYDSDELLSAIESDAEYSPVAFPAFNGNSLQARPIPNSLIPAANMIPVSINTGSGRPEGLQKSLSTLDVASSMVESESQSGFGHGNSEASVSATQFDGPQARNTQRRDYSTRQTPDSHQKVSGRKRPSSQEAPSLGKKRESRLHPALRAEYADNAYSSPPIVQRTLRSMASGPDDNVSYGDDDEARNDADPVQGSAEGTIAVTRPTPLVDTRSSIVVPMKIAARSQDLDTIRQRLASKILDVLLTGLQHPNIVLLLDMVDLLESVWKLDRSRLLDVYGQELNEYRGNLWKWSHCIKALVEFCELTGFRGDETTRAEFLIGAFEDVPPAAARAFIHARSTIAEWRDEPDFSDDSFARNMASILFHSASWADMMKLSQMETCTVEFNGKLLSWFS